ncbi:HNH endonuclease [Chromobacterium piscinae]|uniref:HNH endonuclease n=1 Tax=Chromobacterium piscinae TaxID=686831 RepID=UPI001E5E3AE7|nr:HNH endonuclease signature motif containing protein [Chromobacterium piscinae]MCD4504181.1 HNH endonuclease [Chromobacterium piscinae]
MKSSVRPNIVEPDNFDTFIKYRSGDTRVNLVSIQKKIPYYYRHYDSHGSSLHKIRPNRLSGAEKDTMIQVYESYESNAIVAFRDALFEHIPVCAYCGLGETVHLDHYLPKSEFAEYALYTDNLIPCCYNCNSKYKKTGYEEGGDRVYFHPYIDSVNDFDVLRASVRVINGSVIINYNINATSGVDTSTALVLKKHFKNLGLRERYLKYATLYLSGMKPVFANEYGLSQDIGKLKDALDSKYVDALAEYGKNHWKSALLQNLRSNDEFCGGGFLNV